jgi:hypothetical protein
MKTMTFKRKVNRWRRWTTGEIVTELGSWKCGSVELCNYDVRQYFALGRTKTFTLVFSKAPHPEAYRIEAGVNRRFGLPSQRIPMVDGYEPTFMDRAQSTFLNLWDEGYNYVRCEVPDVE